MMKRLFTLLILSLPLTLVADPYNDSIARLCYSEMQKVADQWKTFPTSFDTVFCGGHCKKAQPRPIILHHGTFPSGSEFDFVEAKSGDVLGPYVDRNCVGVYRFIERKLVCDSMQLSQILVSWKGATNAPPSVKRNRDKAKLKADSLCHELRIGRIYIDEICTGETDDPGSWNGNDGNYGWLTRDSDYPVDLLDAGFCNDTGSYLVVETQLGFHVIRVEKHSRMWDGYITWEIARTIDTCANRDGTPRAIGSNFEGGIGALNSYFLTNASKYDSLKNTGQRRPVLVVFDVLPDGTTANVAVFKQWWITPGMVRGITCLVKDMPPWNPARTCDGTIREGIAVVIYL